MVVTSIRDYLRKMSETTDQPATGPRAGSVRMSSSGLQDSSTVSVPTKCGVTLILMLALPRNGQINPRWVSRFDRHNSKMGMDQRVVDLDSLKIKYKVV